MHGDHFYNICKVAYAILVCRHSAKKGIPCNQSDFQLQIRNVLHCYATNQLTMKSSPEEPAYFDNSNPRTMAPTNRNYSAV